MQRINVKQCIRLVCGKAAEIPDEEIDSMKRYMEHKREHFNHYLKEGLKL